MSRFKMGIGSKALNAMPLSLPLARAFEDSPTGSRRKGNRQQVKVAGTELDSCLSHPLVIALDASARSFLGAWAYKLSERVGSSLTTWALKAV
mmetsp:Transcript_11544/g.20504  ORF Transcript_11544/g.20504 Transcript_11544/m.20504 type:complete len:93 (+) Transcript_11544:2843-3121(+)